MQFFVCFTWLNTQQWGEEGYTRRLLPLFLTKSFCFLDGKEELLFQLLEAFVRGQIQAVKTEKTKRKDHDEQYEGSDAL